MVPQWSYTYGLFEETYHAHFGGAEVQMYLLAKELAKDEENYAVDFVTACQGVPSNEVYNNIRLYKAFTTVNSFNQNGIFTILKKFINSLKLAFILYKINADVYIQRNAGVETAIAAFISKLRNKNFIYMASHETDCTGEYIKKNRVTGRIFLYGIKKASKIVT